jgi:hypothetical protein
LIAIHTTALAIHATAAETSTGNQRLPNGMDVMVELLPAAC